MSTSKVVRFNLWIPMSLFGRSDSADGLYTALRHRGVTVLLETPRASRMNENVEQC
jgi:hypothetical protein